MEFKKVKIVVTVPMTHSDIVRNALGKVGAGTIGNYSYCSLSHEVTGRFIPNEKASPHVGKINKQEEVKEERIEVQCDLKKAKEVIEAMKKVHPYEEVAYDVYPLLDF